MFLKKLFRKIFKKEIEAIALTKEEKETLKEFGTLDEERIKEMRKVLENRIYRTRCKNLNLILGDNLSIHAHLIYIKNIANKNRVIARERHAMGLSPTDKELCITEKMIIRLDNKILEKQLADAYYTPEQSKIIVENIRKNYSSFRYEICSNNIDDYKINKNLSVSIKTTKERYENATKGKTTVFENEITM